MVDTPTVEQVDRRIAENRAKHDGDLAAIESDQHLSPEGRAIKEAEVKNAARETHEQLKSARTAAAKHEQDRYYARAFQRGVASIDSYRGVYSMAAAAPDEKALAKLKAQAVNTNDSMLLKAVYHAAYDRNYVSLLNDAPAEVQNLLEYEYENFLRKANDSLRRKRQLNERLALGVRTTAPAR